MSKFRTRFAAAALIAALTGGFIELGATSASAATSASPRTTVSTGQSSMAPVTAKPCWRFKKAKKRRHCYNKRSSWGWGWGWWGWKHRGCGSKKVVISVRNGNWHIKRYRKCGWRSWW
ncbi:hypothetical protein [Nonomuraea soli]|uniref:BcpO-related WXXGXW repeat protein n=1 Tax=Nonomuraea soli TaxID=1032476 RepID=A0A7W0CRH9_9ACTN|nr:hypothetical protein [Nonomuraea soli]MBA2895859.1 hypothetical protein [Nonomuraea soli]